MKRKEKYIYWNCIYYPWLHNKPAVVFTRTFLLQATHLLATFADHRFGAVDHSGLCWRSAERPCRVYPLGSEVGQCSGRAGQHCARRHWCSSEWQCGGMLHTVDKPYRSLLLVWVTPLKEIYYRLGLCSGSIHFKRPRLLNNVSGTYRRWTLVQTWNWVKVHGFVTKHNTMNKSDRQQDSIGQEH